MLQTHFPSEFKANLAEIQPKKQQNVQKRIFCKKFQESMGEGLTYREIKSLISFLYIVAFTNKSTRYFVQLNRYTAFHPQVCR